MKKQNTVIVKNKKRNHVKEKVLTLIVLSIILVFMLINIILTIVSNKKFAKELNDFAKLNFNTVFSIDKIYLYSSASADNNGGDRAAWNINVHQFTDMAIYINNRSDQELNYENSIKEMYIENVRFSGLEIGNPSLSFKDVQEFAMISKNNENIITDKLEYTVLNDGDIDFTKPQIYADASNPIILEYKNENIKDNEIISDISSELRFDGELLRKTGVFLSKIKCNVAFDIIIVNNYNQKYIANVYIDIPLEDSETGDTIYNGKFVKKLENTNLIRFFRIQ